MNTIESVNSASDGELLAFYNEFVPPGNLKKFKTRKIAETKVSALIAEQVSRKGDYTIVTADEHNVARNAEPPTAEVTKAAEPGSTQKVKRARTLKPETIARNDKHKADLAESVAERKADREHRVAKRKAEQEAKANAEPVVRGPKPYAKPPRPEIIRAVTAGTRVSRLIDLLARPQGATEEEIKAIGIANSARSWLAYDLNTVVGYGFESTDGVNFRLVLPAGLAGVIPHKVKIVTPKGETQVTTENVAVAA